MLGRRITGIRYLAAAGESSERASILERLLDEAARQAEDLGAECLVHRSYADDAPAIHALERRGFLLVDTLLDYGFDFPRGELPVPSPLPPGALATRENLEGLIEVSGRLPAHRADFIPTRGFSLRRFESTRRDRSSVEGFADWVGRRSAAEPSSATRRGRSLRRSNADTGSRSDT